MQNCSGAAIGECCCGGSSSLLSICLLVIFGTTTVRSILFIRCHSTENKSRRRDQTLPYWFFAIHRTKNLIQTCIDSFLWIIFLRIYSDQIGPKTRRISRIISISRNVRREIFGEFTPPFGLSQSVLERVWARHDYKVCSCVSFFGARKS